ncbi:dicer-like 3 [Wolffia australiana]
MGCNGCGVNVPADPALQEMIVLGCEDQYLANTDGDEQEIGALDDQFLPVTENDVKANDIEVALFASGVGTKRRKELHGSTAVRSLSGTWANDQDPVTLQCYKVEFLCSDNTERYSSFVLLIDAVLDSDISHAEINLNLGDIIVKSSVSPCGSLLLSTAQVDDAKKFHEFFFNGLFGKLLTGSASAEGPKIFLLSPENRPSWIKSMYFLLPANTSFATSPENFIVDWKSVQACAHVIDFMNRRFLSKQKEILPVSAEDPSVECKKVTCIRLADKSLPLNEHNNMVVLAIHTGKLYTVIDLLTEMSAESPFDDPDAGYFSFSDYFHKKFGIVLRHPEQPLFLLKHTHNSHNLLYLPSVSKGGSSHRENRKKKPQTHAHMPPELLISVGVSESILKTFYLLPSLMYRLESLMLASQLKEEIRSACNVSCFLILEAITTLRCDESFSMERLELLGDSVLKYAVSCNLFLNHQQHQEGQLSVHRAKQVCNATLHRLGINQNLQVYIRDAPFDPQSWVAPGQIGLRTRDCNCNLENSEAQVKVFPDKDEGKFIIGRACDKGHRWLCSKTISDCVEALIGAYYVGGGLEASKDFMRWLSMDIDFEPARLEEFIQGASLCSNCPQQEDLQLLETKLKYKFAARGLLLEALTHPSLIDSHSCYQRLEFLGDAVLDLLITWYLFKTHEDIDPGKLTVLRAASVSNENFGQVSVRNNLHDHLLHGSDPLLEQVKSYVESVENEDSELPPSVKVPKVLGDMVESMAGAVLVDSKLDLGVVWAVFHPLLSPIATPSSLKLPPFSLLLSLSSTHALPLHVTCTPDGPDQVLVELRLRLGDSLLVRQSRNRSKKEAKAAAAALLLRDLQACLLLLPLFYFF